MIQSRTSCRGLARRRSRWATSHAARFGIGRGAGISTRAGCARARRRGQQRDAGARDSGVQQGAHAGAAQRDGVGEPRVFDPGHFRDPPIAAVESQQPFAPQVDLRRQALRQVSTSRRTDRGRAAAALRTIRESPTGLARRTARSASRAARLTTSGVDDRSMRMSGALASNAGRAGASTSLAIASVADTRMGSGQRLACSEVASRATSSTASPAFAVAPSSARPRVVSVTPARERSSRRNPMAASRASTRRATVATEAPSCAGRRRQRRCLRHGAEHAEIVPVHGVSLTKGCFAHSGIVGQRRCAQRSTP